MLPPLCVGVLSWACVRVTVLLGRLRGGWTDVSDKEAEAAARLDTILGGGPIGGKARVVPRIA